MPRPPRAHAPAPNLLATISPLPASTIAPAPVPRIPPPYDELLIVNITIGPLLVLWQSIGWPLWMMLRLPHPRLLWVRMTGPSPTAVWRMARRAARGHAAQPRAPFRMPGLRWPMLQWEWTSVRHAVAFAIVLTFVLLPVKFLGLRAGFSSVRGRVLSATAEAFSEFQSGGRAITRSSFSEAARAFDRAREALEALPNATGTLPRLAFTVGPHIPGLRSTLGAAEDGRRAGIALAAASGAAARGFAILETLDIADARAAALLDTAAASFASARRFASDARVRVARTAPQWTAPLDRATAELERAEALLPILRALSGVDRPRRILLVFQNPAELRPTGGFIGSVALLDVAAGRIQSLELPGGGAYDISGVTRLRVAPPDPLRLLTDTWQFHDANWFADFPTSARQIRWSLEASGGPSVDGVVAVNAPVLERLLARTGPITVDGQTFSASTAVATLTDSIESTDARATGQPKAVLGALAPEILQRLFAMTNRGAPRERLQILDDLLLALEQRDILLAFTDDTVQRHAARMRWAGAIRPATHDALLVVHTNIGGGKSDAVIRDDIAHAAEIFADGSVVDTVTITRAHMGTPTPADGTPSARLRSMRNIDYVRIYVPRDAQLITASGFDPPPAGAFAPPATDALPERLLLATEIRERTDPATGLRITEEFGRSVFGGWMQIPAGTTQTARIVYRIPWQYAADAGAKPESYTIAIQKQPGTRATFRHTVTLAPAWRAVWRAENLRPAGANAWSLEDILATDAFTGLLIAPTDAQSP